MATCVLKPALVEQRACLESEAAAPVSAAARE